MKLRFNRTLWLYAYLSVYPIYQVHSATVPALDPSAVLVTAGVAAGASSAAAGAGSAAPPRSVDTTIVNRLTAGGPSGAWAGGPPASLRSSATTVAATVAEMLRRDLSATDKGAGAGSAGGGAAVAPRSFPPTLTVAGYEHPYISVPSLEFTDHSLEFTDRYYQSTWADIWHVEMQKRIKEIRGSIAEETRFPRDVDSHVPNIACARLTLVFQHKPSDKSTPLLLPRHDANTNLFFSGLGWTRWDDEGDKVKAYIATTGLRPVAMESFLPVPSGKNISYHQHRQASLQLRDFFTGSSWSRLPSMRTIQDDIEVRDRNIFWVDRSRYSTEADFRREEEYVRGWKRTFGENFFDSEQGILRYYLDYIQKGMLRELVKDIPIGACLRRVVLDIASYEVMCDWCGHTYFWEAESRNLIANAVIESLRMICPDVIIDNAASKLFVEFSGKGVVACPQAVATPFHINTIWPYIAARNFEDTDLASVPKFAKGGKR